ncbi:MAG: histidine kinase dimerization/phospho-acceptor domain-containing protein [Paracoccaceae bacterium]
MVAAGSVLGPIDRLTQAVARRGPTDLRAVDHPTPRELVPLVGALNGFIARLRGALTRTETFIAEAAHHIRTPLATVRAQTEIALRKSDDEDLRQTLRRVIRSVEESSRSAGQLLDHATVVYRSDRLAAEQLDLADLARSVARALAPTAELKDMTLTLQTDPRQSPATGCFWKARSETCSTMPSNTPPTDPRSPSRFPATARRRGSKSPTGAAAFRD